MIFETTKMQQDEVNQETILSLTSQIEEQNDKAAKQAETFSKLTTRLEKCKGLIEHLELAEKWRSRLKEVLQKTGGKLENFASVAINVAHDAAVLLDEKKKIEMLVDAAKVHKLRSQRKARITKDWLASDECGAFMAKLFGEMFNNDILLKAEAHRLVAARGVQNRVPGRPGSGNPGTRFFGYLKL